MKVKIFFTTPSAAERHFNKWAKGKALTKNVIIHTEGYPASKVDDQDLVLIAIYYPEGSQFDTETTK